MSSPEPGGGRRAAGTAHGERVNKPAGGWSSAAAAEPAPTPFVPRSLPLSFPPSRPPPSSRLPPSAPSSFFFFFSFSLFGPCRPGSLTLSFFYLLVSPSSFPLGSFFSDSVFFQHLFSLHPFPLFVLLLVFPQSLFSLSNLSLLSLLFFNLFRSLHSFLIPTPPLPLGRSEWPAC